MDYIHTHSINFRTGIKGASCYLTEENRMQLLELERNKTKDANAEDKQQTWVSEPLYYKQNREHL